MAQCYRITFTYSGIRARKWPLTTNNQHSFLLCIISKATWRTKRVFTTEFQWLVFGTVASICSNIGTFFSPLRTAWLKATCYTLSLTHTHTQLQTYTHRPSQKPLTQRLRLILQVLRSSSGVSCC